MKKIIKRILITATVVLALAGLGGITAFASGYIEWAGSNDFRQAMENLNLIQDESGEMKSEYGQLQSVYEELQTDYYETNQNNEQLQNTIKEKENLILDKDNRIEALEKEVKSKKDGNETSTDQLKQAGEDMNDVNQKTQEVLEGF